MRLIGPVVCEVSCEQTDTHSQMINCKIIISCSLSIKRFFFVVVVKKYQMALGFFQGNF